MEELLDLFEEPIDPNRDMFICPVCADKWKVDYIDDFSKRPISLQHCFKCGWTENAGCDECILSACYSWKECGGRYLNIIKKEK